MVNTVHSTMSGSDLHEPKGIGSATVGQLYVANGSGSGAWSSASSAVALTGQIADFATPVAPTGWLECDGTSISRTTYATLFTALTIQQTGSRTNGSAIITGLSSTTNMKAGYTVGGTGITAGSTILTVDSSTQITISANATSTGSGTVIISPLVFDGTNFTLPDLTTAGRYRRSRTSSLFMGVSQADQNKAHTHLVSGSTGIESLDHTHVAPDHTHLGGDLFDAVATSTFGPVSGGTTFATAVNNSGSGNTGGSNTATMTTSGAGSNHTHTVSITSASSGSTEVRPVSYIVMTCIRT